ncbi:MAG: penicillin-binding protein 2 [Hyphomonas sp. BRH_c22]|uniref:penicillin-binding protein 2 n=1 Tax=Hyphomonas sp. BRH_c22 TaxID=1629710 RepID=UPI0005F13818|nr:penicillin-binding protein 2 [Hyphomonas sp. BRH_c22]KJS36571.1 MAG: penicillin-binding protein 2 [Hyphomonas sp. BRH_c22]
MSHKPSIEDDFSRRMILAAGAGGVVWAGLIARLFQLQVLESEKYQAAAEDNHIKLALAPPQRGRILDRFGKPLASHRRAGRVSIVPEQTRDPAATLAKIAALIELPDERVEKLIKEIATSRRRNAGFVPVIVANELTYEDFASMNVHAAEIPGVQVEMALTRSYPRGRDLAHVLGYVARASQDDLDRLSVGMVDDEAKRLEKLFRHPDMRTGRQGMERFAEEWLRGKPGFRKQVTNAHGRVIEEIPDEKFAPVAGKDLYITIDSELQRAAIERFGEESGAAVVLDVETGDVLAMVSTPAFDPNDFVNGISGSAYAALRDNPRSPLYPRAHGGVYPPGSTFKMVVATAALESGAVKPTDRVHCNRYYHFGNRTWHCWKKGGHGSVDMHSAIKGSCDVYFYEIARRTGVDAIAATARKFGFGEAWTLGMTGARGGLVPDPEWKQKALGEQWYEGETLNFGIGQGQLGVTPLQLALMTARIASEGHSLKPKLVGLGPKTEQDGILDAPLDGDIMRRMKAGMFGVTSEGGGTAYRSGDLGLGGPRLAGKTGTAQVRRITQAERDKGIRKGDEIERELRDHALFVAYAPADDPKYAIAVVVEHGEGGSSTAAPLARDILHFALKNDSRRKPAYGQTASVNTPGQGEPT